MQTFNVVLLAYLSAASLAVMLLRINGAGSGRMEKQIVVLGTPPRKKIEEFSRAIKASTLFDSNQRQANPNTLIYRGAIDRLKFHQLAKSLHLDVWIRSIDAKPIQLFVADMEATVIQDEMLDILAEERGIGNEVSQITARAMAGEIDFAQSLIERTRLLAGTPETQLKELCGRIRYMPGAKALLTNLRASGVRTVLVTGGYRVFADAVAEACGFEEVVANAPVLSRGVMTGELEHPICDADTKRAVLLKHCTDLGIDPGAACCIGDGANDVLMLRACGFPVSYKGKPIVQEIVDINMTHGDLSTLLLALDANNTKVEQA